MAMLCNACGSDAVVSATLGDDDPGPTTIEAFKLRLDQLELELKMTRQEVAEVSVSQPRQELAEPKKDEVAEVQLEEVVEGLPPENLQQATVDSGDAGDMSDEDDIEQQIITKRERYRDHMQERIRKRIRYFQQQGLSDNDGDKETDLTLEQRNSIDQNFFMKQYAKDQICACTTAKEIIMKAELLIDEDWLDKVDALPGNLFCVGAFGQIFDKGTTAFSTASLKAYSKYFGCCLIILIQLIGPPLIFVSRMPGNVGGLNENKYEWRCHPLVGSSSSEVCPSGRMPGEIGIMDDWKKLTLTKLLGVIFITAFILNGLFSILDEKKTWRDLYNTFRFLDWKNEDFKAPGSCYLFVGAFVNCWVVVWSCLDIYVVVGATPDPQDLLMDALALLFLFNLDDVGGDLCFVDDDDWPGLRIAWIYQELVHPWPDDEFDEDKLDPLGTASMMIYKATIALLCLQLASIPLLATITPFIDIAPSN